MEGQCNWHGTRGIVLFNKAKSSQLIAQEYTLMINGSSWPSSSRESRDQTIIESLPVFFIPQIFMTLFSSSIYQPTGNFPRTNPELQLKTITFIVFVEFLRLQN